MLLTLSVVVLLEIRRGDCVARTKVTFALVVDVPWVALTAQVSALVAVRSVPIIRQPDVLVENRTRALVPPVQPSFTTEPTG